MTHDDFMRGWLGDRDNAAGYLRECLASGDKGLFLDAVRRIADAQGLGVRGIAQLSGLGRETLYRTLSESGNPEITSLIKILDALGMRLSVETNPKRRVARRKVPARAGRRMPAGSTR